MLFITTVHFPQECHNLSQVGNQRLTFPSLPNRPGCPAVQQPITPYELIARENSCHVRKATKWRMTGNAMPCLNDLFGFQRIGTVVKLMIKGELWFFLRRNKYQAIDLRSLSLQHNSLKSLRHFYFELFTVRTNETLQWPKERFRLLQENLRCLVGISDKSVKPRGRCFAAHMP